MKELPASVPSPSPAPPAPWIRTRLRPRSRTYYAHTAQSRGAWPSCEKVFSHPSVLRRRFAFDKPEDLVDEHPDHRIERFTRWGVEPVGDGGAKRPGPGGSWPSRRSPDWSSIPAPGISAPGCPRTWSNGWGSGGTSSPSTSWAAGAAGRSPICRCRQALLEGRTPMRPSSCVSVEICTSTFQMEDDLSLIVSNALFADGAAASVLWNRPRA